MGAPTGTVPMNNYTWDNGQVSRPRKTGRITKTNLAIMRLRNIATYPNTTKMENITDAQAYLTGLPNVDKIVTPSKIMKLATVTKTHINKQNPCSGRGW